jgi:hypothetical protein
MSAKILDALDSVITAEITDTISPVEQVNNLAYALKQLQTVMDPLIHKMAIIGEQLWESIALAFSGKGHRAFPIEFFPAGHLREANSW